MQYVPKEVVWAKVEGYPWWPAKVIKLPTKQIPFFKVQFIGEDTHAHLEKKFIKHYLDEYEKLSSKKSKKLQNAINKADELHRSSQAILEKQRQKSIAKQPTTKTSSNSQNNRRGVTNASNGKSCKDLKKAEAKGTRQENKQKNCSKRFSAKYDKHSQNEDSSSQKQEEQPRSSSSLNSSIQNNYISQIAGKNNGSANQEEHGQENVSEDFLVSTEKENDQSNIDRTKIDKIENELLSFIHKIQEDEQFIASSNLANYIAYFDAACLTPEELCQSKITKMMAYFIKKAEEYDDSSLQELKGQLLALSRSMKDKVLTYLNNTDYYDNCIRQIHKAQTQKAEFQKKITIFLKRMYLIKTQLAKLFAEKMAASIGNYPELKNEFLNDLKSKKLEALGSITSKIAVDRAVEEILAHYE